MRCSKVCLCATLYACLHKNIIGLTLGVGSALGPAPPLPSEARSRDPRTRDPGPAAASYLPSELERSRPVTRRADTDMRELAHEQERGRGATRRADLLPKGVDLADVWRGGLGRGEERETDRERERERDDC